MPLVPEAEFQRMKMALKMVEIMDVLGFKEVQDPTESKALSCEHYKTLDELVGCETDTNGQVVCNRCDWVSGWTIQHEDKPPEACNGYDAWSFGLPSKTEGSTPKFVQFGREDLPMACGTMTQPFGGCMRRWKPADPSQGQNRKAHTDATQKEFYDACLLAKQQLENMPDTKSTVTQITGRTN